MQTEPFFVAVYMMRAGHTRILRERVRYTDRGLRNFLVVWCEVELGGKR